MEVFSPVRLGIVGGGTDLPFFYQKHGGRVLSAALNFGWRIRLLENSRREINIELDSDKAKFGVGSELKYRGDGLDVVRGVINHFIPFEQGFSLIINKDRELTGLGSSGSLIVALCYAFSIYKDQEISKKQLAETAYIIENNELGWLTGKQDQYTASFGGINLFYFAPGGKIYMQGVGLPDWIMGEFKRRLTIFYVGGQRKSFDLQKKLARASLDRKHRLGLVSLKEEVTKSVYLLRKGDFDNLGRFINMAWEAKKLSNPYVSTGMIDRIYSLALESGALGGKLSGAGQAGYVFFITRKNGKQQLVSALKTTGIENVDFDFNFGGATLT